MKKVTFSYDQLDDIIADPRLLPIVSQLCKQSGMTSAIAILLARSQVNQLEILFKDLPPDFKIDFSTGDLVHLDGSKASYDAVKKSSSKILNS